MKIERAWLRIVACAIVGGVVSFASYIGIVKRASPLAGYYWFMVVVPVTLFLAGPVATGVLMHLLTPREPRDGHTRCGKCGYILKGLTELRCSECGESI